VAGVTLDQVRSTYKARDSWWTVLLVDPLAARLVRLIVGRTWLTPTRLTVIAFALGLVAAAAFLAAGPAWLVAGAVLYYASFTIDCVDGKVARLRDETSVVGSWLDFLLDRIRVVVATGALFGGQFLATENPAFLVAAAVVVLLSLFGYLNGAEVDKARQQMTRPDAGQEASGDVEAREQETTSPGTAARLRAALHRRRIRMNLVSGVEFDMALFVLAPLLVAALGAGALIGVVVVVGALLAVFELALIARFWLAARAFDRQRQQSSVPAQRDLARLDDQAPAGR
jgi:phosphatidylglycerophosphate synthase